MIFSKFSPIRKLTFCVKSLAVKIQTLFFFYELFFDRLAKNSNNLAEGKMIPATPFNHPEQRFHEMD